MRRFAEQIKVVVGKQTYDYLMESNPSGENLNWIFSRKGIQLEPLSNRWWAFYNYFFIPLLNDLFNRDKKKLSEVINLFCKTYNKKNGRNLGYWSLELDANFIADPELLLEYFPEPQRSMLNQQTVYRKKRMTELDS